jgi:hypothetical protein
MSQNKMKEIIVQYIWGQVGEVVSGNRNLETVYIVTWRIRRYKNNIKVIVRQRYQEGMGQSAGSLCLMIL